MANTTNFGWETPDDTDLVKDGALAMRTLGNAIDTSLVDLKGGTTGQVLSKTSNTDMDFSWVTSDDANAIQNAIVDAKGDLITATAADTPARLAVGSNGDTLVADSAATTGLRWQGNYSAGKNKIINGDFNINQRGFTSSTSSGYGFDRWRLSAVDGTITYSAQTFTAGAAPVSGYEATNFARVASTGQTATNAVSLLAQRIEDVRTLAGQTATISFWAKAASGTPKVAVEIEQVFGSGGSPSASVTVYGGQVTLGTTWQRYSVTFTGATVIPSLSGKTVGTTANTSELRVLLWTSAGTDFNARTGSLGIQTNTIDFWGVQLEAGSVATAFQTATGTLQGELAACQRYYWRNTNGASTGIFASGGVAFSTTQGIVPVVMPVPMRITPTSLDTTGTASNYRLYNGSINTALSAVPTIGAGDSTPNVVMLNVTVASGLTAGSNFQLSANSSSTAYLGFGAEL
jgi:hypothetical protein